MKIRKNKKIDPRYVVRQHVCKVSMPSDNLKVSKSEGKVSHIGRFDTKINTSIFGKQTIFSKNIFKFGKMKKRTRGIDVENVYAKFQVNRTMGKGRNP